MDSSGEIAEREDALNYALAVLRRQRASLNERGVRHAWIFGSVARREETDGSDIDIVLELAREARLGTGDLILLGDHLEQLLQRRVDVLARDGLRPGAHEEILREMIAAF